MVTSTEVVASTQRFPVLICSMHGFLFDIDPNKNPFMHLCIVNASYPEYFGFVWLFLSEIGDVQHESV